MFNLFYYENFTVEGGNSLLIFPLPPPLGKKSYFIFCKHPQRYYFFNISIKFIHNGK